MNYRQKCYINYEDNFDKSPVPTRVWLPDVNILMKRYHLINLKFLQNTTAVYQG